MMKPAFFLLATAAPIALAGCQKLGIEDPFASAKRPVTFGYQLPAPPAAQTAAIPAGFQPLPTVVPPLPPPPAPVVPSPPVEAAPLPSSPTPAMGAEPRLPVLAKVDTPAMKALDLNPPLLSNATRPAVRKELVAAAEGSSGGPTRIAPAKEPAAAPGPRPVPPAQAETLQKGKPAAPDTTVSKPAEPPSKPLLADMPSPLPTTVPAVPPITLQDAAPPPPPAPPPLPANTQVPVAALSASPESPSWAYPAGTSLRKALYEMADQSNSRVEWGVNDDRVLTGDFSFSGPYPQAVNALVRLADKPTWVLIAEKKNGGRSATLVSPSRIAAP